MASVVATKNRLKSAKSTQKVIKAMELVASSKIRRAREKALGIEFFYDTTMDAMQSLYTHTEVKTFLHNKNNEDKTLLVAFTSDMGLCGAYNGNITKRLLTEINSIEHTECIVVGTKGVNKLNYEKKKILHSIVNVSNKPEFDIANEITDLIIKKHASGEINQVKVIYTKFVNAMVQKVEVIDLFDLESLNSESKTLKPNLLIEPDELIVFKQLLNQYVLSVIYTATLQSLASEHSYRRNSMESANKNSLELIDQLNLDLNRIRQAMITQEISEIIGGSEALSQ